MREIKRYEVASVERSARLTHKTCVYISLLRIFCISMLLFFYSIMCPYHIRFDRVIGDALKMVFDLLYYIIWKYRD